MSDHRRLFLLLVVCLLLVMPACRDMGEDEDEGNVPDTTGISGIPAADDDDNDDNDDDHIGSDDDDGPQPPPGGTKYPIVMMHGFFGWGEAGPFSYYAGVVDDLTALGFEVIDPNVSPIHSMEHRSAQWVEAIDAVYAGRKINVVCHSQGGLDARYMISQLGWGDRIAAVVMVATPNQGSALADYIADQLPAPAQWAVDWVLNLLGMDWDGIYQISQAYIRNVFNPANPDDPRVAYYSYQTDCGDDCFFLLKPSHALLEQLEGANDGVVPTAGSAYGVEMGIEHADHWSVIGQPIGLTHDDHKQLYRDIAFLLQDEGF